jgi:hypothetical protein
MPKIQKNFIKGRMNKSVDERLVPQGEYIDALNVRLGSTEGTEIGQSVSVLMKMEPTKLYIGLSTTKTILIRLREK